MRVIGGEGGVVRSVLNHDADDGSESPFAALSRTDRLPCVALFPSPSAHPPSGSAIGTRACIAPNLHSRCHQQSAKKRKVALLRRGLVVCPVAKEYLHNVVNELTIG